MRSRSSSGNTATSAESKRERDKRYDAKREPYHRWYHLAVWHRIRAQQLQRQPLCERHLKRSEIVAANTVNHIKPHKGDWSKFVAGPFESLCQSCHSCEVQGEESRGYSDEIDHKTGWPADQRHPANKKR